MAELGSFVPTGFDIRDDAGGDNVAIRFLNGEDYFQTVLPKAALAPLFDRILRTLRIAPLSPMQEGHAGGVLTPQGHDVHLEGDGTISLNIHLRTDDGPRTMSWGMSPEKALKLSEELQKRATT